MNINVDAIEQQLKLGDLTLFDDAFSRHRPRLWQIIHFRLSDQVRARVDADDVLQDVYLDAEKRLNHFVEGDFPSLFLWLRLVTGQTLSRVHRRHLATESRSTLRESSPNDGNLFGNTSLCLSQRFIAHMTSPSQAAVKAELIVEVRSALESMNEIDREVLALRHFEELTNQEVAIELDIKPKAASIRYMRALERLRGVLEVIR
ncbi:RNA polymerase sigma-70 factor, ECF subfamily [Neorhodopirellula lusitana]|uniref:RNA polymerase sigma-70 factor, ECF subfamily n=1 Tax=Neorhodopirellula lusitana TaxID=445327 RepID=A0ABY1QHP8_9BACT|nr:sigma-70 family RNA polymerase sigma factor [Neorhodopirellula lusitana]SMP71337.1 RNA polymerase sigma-70 factor, ECF subfamily [Neorhodopirellula lusitana]